MAVCSFVGYDDTMKERLPNVHKKFIWVIVAVLTAAAFFMLWSLRGGDTPGAINSDKDSLPAIVN